LTACTVASRLTKRTARSWTSTSRALPLRRSGIGRLAVARARIEHVAGRGMRLVASPKAEHRVAGLAHRLGERAARVKAAARRGGGGGSEESRGAAALWSAPPGTSSDASPAKSA